LDHHITPKAYPMKNSAFRSLLLTFLAFGVLLLAACHTVEGAGKDIKEVGEEIEETSQETQK